MNKEFIPYEQALALKELGFDEPCFAKYTVIPEDEIDWFMIPEQGITNKTSFGSSKNYNSKSFEEEGTISAPTFSQAFRWFREKYKIGYNITWNKFYENTPYQWEVRKYWENEPTIPYGYASMSKTYEEAELACLEKLIKIVKNGK